jgi:Family of unknown function (DUF6011)
MMGAYTDLIVGMIDQLEDGYYAVQPDSNTPLTFMRVSRPTYGKLKGYVKIQTQHSDTLIDRWLYNPAQTDPLFRVRELDRTIEPKILLLLANKRAAGRRYAHEIGKCHRCNKKLTDHRSRHYGFGPECELELAGEKDEIDDENGGTYEELLARGEIDHADH